MRDGNKESAKELLSTFRMVAGAAISIFLLFANLQIRGVLHPQNSVIFTVGLAAQVLSVLLCSWLFLMVVGKLHREDEDIAYQVPTLVIGGGAMACFLLGIICLLLGQV
jgi:hypothetical protein